MKSKISGTIIYAQAGDLYQLTDWRKGKIYFIPGYEVRDRVDEGHTVGEFIVGYKDSKGNWINAKNIIKFIEQE